MNRDKISRRVLPVWVDDLWNLAPVLQKMGESEKNENNRERVAYGWKRYLATYIWSVAVVVVVALILYALGMFQG